MYRVPRPQGVPSGSLGEERKHLQEWGGSKRVPPPPSPNSTRSQDLGEEEDRVKKQILKEKRFGGKTKGGRINGLL